MSSIFLDNIPFPREELALRGHNTELGRFMTAWGQIEVLYGMIFQRLSGVDREIGSIIFERIGVREQLEILLELAAQADKAVGDNLLETLKEVERLSRIRNKLVHARWGKLDNEIARFWVGLTGADIDAIWRETQKGKSLRQSRIFTVVEIKALVSRCTKASNALNATLRSLIEKASQRFGEDGVHAQALQDHLRRLREGR